jgi:hypothetical protein
MDKSPKYTVSRCKLDDSLYGPLHGSEDGNNTICGMKLDENWWITNNTDDGVITCRRCLDVIRSED